MASVLGNSISDIAAKFKLASLEELPELIAHYENDPRSGVQKEILRATKFLEKEAYEATRLENLYSYFKEFDEGAFIIGIDEVGRGPVAGPLTVAACALPPEPHIPLLNDSKQLKPEIREAIVPRIKELALSYAIVHIQPEEIDSNGMSWALKTAFKQAFEETCARIGREADALFIDGNPLHMHPKERSVIKGDAKIACISAASVLAKVTRDALMVEAAETYPGYDFENSKGYASAKHIAAIQELGLTPIHRVSFCQNFLSVQDTLF